MRQWNVPGTDRERGGVIPPIDPGPVGGWTFFWTTDEDLRLRTLSDAAAEVLRVDPAWCEGRDVAELFEGTNLSVVEAHLSALEGTPAGFSLGSIACRVTPVRANAGRVLGTCCVASVPTDVPEPLVATALATAA
jgi:hypothetical protein